MQQKQYAGNSLEVLSIFMVMSSEGITTEKTESSSQNKGERSCRGQLNSRSQEYLQHSILKKTLLRLRQIFGLRITSSKRSLLVENSANAHCPLGCRLGLLLSYEKLSSFF